MKIAFSPASHLPLDLGMVYGLHFEASISRKSAFDRFEFHTELPCLHIAIATTSETTWKQWDPERRGHMSGAIEVTEYSMFRLINHFFGNSLSMENAAWRFEMNSPNAARRQTPHAHLLMGHKDLFGEDGFVRQCVNSALKPDLLTADAVAIAVETAIQAREQEAARTLMNSA